MEEKRTMREDEVAFAEQEINRYFYDHPHEEGVPLYIGNNTPAIRVSKREE
ncbi:hypothetical protein C289_1182 [Anoxybacillus ayderensis]|uniref:hypothetical protein n=1 Tax=Anoxybacillus ayderensis TaxID=265546 RepID=UPI000385535E|nr:hypothetical protein [Anoxybacillus ayderensis]EPZ38841.1 hypothetical protein C289_1182 [Anoxybacillus ayderensis]MBA2877985.1 hypothetical protein [Anoxybacillus ayderensis]MCL6616397.1 hypothetical protein [Anoxybacillus ayderensis]MED0657880.1 hypothetical protein [Anoxybacillus ayderensis]MED0686767.1 hypothetical protein [Anoxybacillus ayderensis]